MPPDPDPTAENERLRASRQVLKSISARLDELQIEWGRIARLQERSRIQPGAAGSSRRRRSQR
jgi:hypothetical protein